MSAESERAFDLGCRRPAIGVVCGGGGARGAYEVGVLSGLREVLREHALPLRFDVLVGSSIGALNATWLGAHAQDEDMGIDSLVHEWNNLRLEDSFRLHWPRHRKRNATPSPFSLLDPRAIECLVQRRIPWAQLNANLSSHRICALVVTALNIGTGRTTAFAQLAPGASYRTSRDPRRNAFRVHMGPEHVLASSAFPWLFPARSVDGAFYCDGGLRLNTPIAPALRAGSDKLVVISLLASSRTRQRGPRPPPEASTALQRERVHAFPSPVFLLGKVLNALLLDPIEYDLQVLDRFNRLMEVLEKQLEPGEMAHVNCVLTQSRGAPYKRVPTLAFQPSRNIGEMAGEFLERRQLRSGAALMLKYLSRLAHTWEADLMSFVLLDGEYARELIDLGRRDVREREAEVVEFFSH